MMDRSEEMLAELRLIREQLARQNALLEAETKRVDSHASYLRALDERVRKVEQGLAKYGVITGAAGGIGVLLLEWLLSR